MLISGGSFQVGEVVDEVGSSVQGSIYLLFCSTVQLCKVPSESLQGWIIELVSVLQPHRVETNGLQTKPQSFLLS